MPALQPNFGLHCKLLSMCIVCHTHRQEQDLMRKRKTEAVYQHLMKIKKKKTKSKITALGTVFQNIA